MSSRSLHPAFSRRRTSTTGAPALGPSICDLLGIDAYAENDLGYAPS